MIFCSLSFLKREGEMKHIQDNPLTRNENDQVSRCAKLKLVQQKHSYNIPRILLEIL
jgi:hypothetical protein